MAHRQCVAAAGLLLIRLCCCMKKGAIAGAGSLLSMSRRHRRGRGCGVLAACPWALQQGEVGLGQRRMNPNAHGAVSRVLFFLQHCTFFLQHYISKPVEWSHATTSHPPLPTH